MHPVVIGAIALLWFWIVWILTHVAAMILWRPKGPAFNGFSVYMPSQCVILLTHGEYVAVFLHEMGHRKHWHVWENLAKVAVFSRTSKKRRQEQELEADSHVIQMGMANELASALKKMGASDEFDLFRISLLENYDRRKTDRPVAETQRNGEDS